jgi:hypothetical protein
VLTAYKNKSTPGLVLLCSALLLLSVAVPYSIAQYGNMVGFGVVGGAIGIALAVVSFLNPRFGFYFCIAFGFLVPLLERWMNDVVSLDMCIEALTYVAFAGALFKSKREGRPYWREVAHPITYAYLVYFIFLFVELVNPSWASLAGTLFYIRKTLQALSIYFTALYVLHSYRDMRFYVKFWIAVAGLCGAYACYQEWVGFAAFETRWIFADETRVAILSLDNGNYRKFSSLTDPAAFGILMSCSALFTLITLLRTPFMRNKIWLLAALVFMLMGMAYSGTRTAIFTLTVGIALYILMNLNSVRTLGFAVFALLAFAFVLFAPIYNNPTLNRMRSTFEFSEDASLDVRNENRQRIQPYIHAHPIGGGLMTTGLQGKKYNPGHVLAGFPTDSGLLRSALETGWIGLIILCLHYLLVLQQAVHTYYKVQKPFIRTFMLAAIAALFGNMIAQYAQVAVGQMPQVFLFYPIIAFAVRIGYMHKYRNPL